MTRRSKAKFDAGLRAFRFVILVVSAFSLLVLALS
jgi:hypothetical protein